MPVKRSPNPAHAVVRPNGGTDWPNVESARLREIYLQASRLFVERGYEATAMSDIADAVKITKAGLYHFVKGKEDLLFTIMSFGMDELEAEVVDPARRIADPGERLTFMIRAHLKNIDRGLLGAGNPVTLVVDEPWGLSGEKRRIINARKRVYFDLIRATLVELQESGRARGDLDPSVSTHSIIGMILWTARWRRPRGRLTIDEVCQHMISLVLLGTSTKP